MFDIQCSCGTRFEVQDDQDPAQVACPGCGTTAAELIALAETLAAQQTAEQKAESPAFLACVNHSGQPGTLRCLHCDKPICFDCVRERGRFCSDTCREAVEAAAPASVPTSAPATRPKLKLADSAPHTM